MDAVVSRELGLELLLATYLCHVIPELRITGKPNEERAGAPNWADWKSTERRGETEHGRGTEYA